MSALIFDVETAGNDIKSFDKKTVDIIKEKLVKDGKEEDVSQILGLSPYTGSVVALGTLDSEKDRGAVYYINPEKDGEERTEDGIIYRSFKNEAEILTKFWDLANNYQTFVSFNGRGFDIPFLLIRSAINKVKPTKDLMRGRYLYQQSQTAQHIDLYDQLSFYSAFRFASGGSLHMACQAFGIVSPKDDGVEGSMVTEMFHVGKYEEIAAYNAGDLWATRSLYNIYLQYLSY